MSCSNWLHLRDLIQNFWAFFPLFSLLPLFFFLKKYLFPFSLSVFPLHYFRVQFSHAGGAHYLTENIKVSSDVESASPLTREMKVQLCPRQPVPPGARRPTHGRAPVRMPRAWPGACLHRFPGVQLLSGRCGTGRGPFAAPSVGPCAGVLLPSPGGMRAARTGRPRPAPLRRDTPLYRDTLPCRDIPF